MCSANGWSKRHGRISDADGARATVAAMTEDAISRTYDLSHTMRAWRRGLTRICKACATRQSVSHPRSTTADQRKPINDSDVSNTSAGLKSLYLARRPGLRSSCALSRQTISPESDFEDDPHVQASDRGGARNIALVVCLRLRRRSRRAGHRQWRLSQHPAAAQS